MKIIFLYGELDRSKTIHLRSPKHWVLSLVAIFLVLVVTLATLISNGFFDNNQYKTRLSALHQAVLSERYHIDVLHQRMHQKALLMIEQAGDLQARMTRIEALGTQLATMASIDDEFDFDAAPAIGGPEDQNASKLSANDSPLMYHDEFLTLKDRLDYRQQQIQALAEVLNSQRLVEETYLAGKPVRKGWLSSKYGFRSDPFSGRRSFHKGIDFASPHGSDILAVASGVVTWADYKPGYGLLVEVNHGNELTTRYAHAQSLLVGLGNVVEKGQPLATVGSSGRSTGPHVHFEVLRHGQQIDPYPYVLR